MSNRKNAPGGPNRSASTVKAQVDTTTAMISTTKTSSTVGAPSAMARWTGSPTDAPTKDRIVSAVAAIPTAFHLLRYGRPSP
ncbi:hypothetical protein ACQGAO_20330 [Rhodococcus sp. 1.20]